MKQSNRREFLKHGALALAALGVSGRPLYGSAAENRTVSSATPEAAAPVISSDPKTKLAVVEGLDPRLITRKAVEALGGMKRFVKPGQVVVIKPNIGWDRPPVLAANTNPQVVEVLVQMCKQAGAAQVKVLDRSCNDPRRTYKNSGIGPAAEKAGAQIIYIDENPRIYKDTLLPKGNGVRSWPVIEEILKADVLINVPIAKHHSATGLSLSLKNCFGMIGGNRGNLHRGIDMTIPAIASAMPVSLVVLDAYRILIRNGPTGGRPQDVKALRKVVAGTNMVSVDAYGVTLFGKKPADIGHIKYASQVGMGEMDISRMEIEVIKT